MSAISLLFLIPVSIHLETLSSPVEGILMIKSMGTGC